MCRLPPAHRTSTRGVTDLAITEAAMDQFSLFGARSDLPEGFKYEPGVISEEEANRLIQNIRELPFKEFEFHGFTGKRRIVSYGWKYDFSKQAVYKAVDIPDFLLELREIAGRFAGIPPEDLQQVLVTEYSEGAGIGWHRDKAVFGDVVGVSLLSPAVFRLRRKQGEKWERASVTAEPRSAYLLRGPSRTEWEHSIPGVPELRYSVTFRNFRDKSA
jgi:alkylated DNA repair dioxygenase AlkB